MYYIESGVKFCRPVISTLLSLTCMSIFLDNIVRLSIFIVVYFRLFEIAPELQKLFPFDGEAVTADNELLKRHGIQVMESIDAAIGMLDNPEELKETLIDLGIVHHMKDVQVDSFAVSTKLCVCVCVCACAHVSMCT